MAVGVLHRPVQHGRHAQQHDEIEQQRGDDFVDAQPAFSSAGPSSSRAPASAAARNISGKSTAVGSGEAFAAMQPADGHRGQRAGIELALGADVEQAGLEGDGGRQAGEDQRAWRG
jgi:hypothetical protein